MSHLNEFSDRDWNMAPIYESPVATPGVVALDFDILKGMVEKEESIGAFRKTPDGSFGKAAVIVDDMKAALYLVDTEGPESKTPNLNTADKETIVVVGGLLQVIRNDGRPRPRPGSLDLTFPEGQVLRFHNNDPISMRAVSHFDRARCIALALYPEEDLGIHIVGKK